MAFSKSVKKSQIPINCHLCDTEKNIKWKCIDCELLICDKCKDGRHLRIKNAQDHKVISIKDIGLHSGELDFTNIKCLDHAIQSCCLFCKICDRLVCPTCVSKVHKKHANDLIEISEAYHMKKERLKNGQSKIQIEEKKAVTKKEQLVKRKNAENAKYSKVIQDILNHGKVLKSDIDKYIKELKNEVDANLKTIFKSIDTDLSIVSKSIKYSNEKNTEVEDLIKSIDDANFFSDVRRMEKSMEVPVPKTQSNYNSIPNFVPREITQSNIGVLQSEDSPEELTVAFNIIQEYPTKLSAISDIVPCVDNSVWIYSYLDSCIVNAIPADLELKVISEFNMKAYGIAITTSNNILLSNGTSKLQQLNIKTGKMSDTVYDVSPLRSTAIHITSDNKVIVGGYHDILGRAVFVMNEKGDHETVYEHDKHNQPILTYPVSITSTSNGNIHVVDCDLGKEGRVVVLAPGSDVINSYKGHPEINKNKAFKPVSIVTTPRGNVMVIELSTFVIHILDSKGNLVSWFNTEEIRILDPLSLAFTPTGQLYIGCGRKASSTVKEAKIYEVTCSGC